MKKMIKQCLLLITILTSCLLLGNSSALAHVVVTPGEITSAQRVSFVVSVPNEHDTPVVGVRLIVPENLTSVRPHAKAGWKVEVKTEGEGEAVSAKEIIWTSNGNNIPVDLKDEFLVSAKAPADTGELIWKAYETYQNGLTVAWDQAPTDDHSGRPYSVTKVVSETEGDKAGAQNDDIKTAANRALIVGVLALVVGISAFYLSLNRRNK